MTVSICDHLHFHRIGHNATMHTKSFFLILLITFLSLPTEAQWVRIVKLQKTELEKELENRVYNRNIFRKTCLDFDKDLRFRDGSVLLEEDDYQKMYGGVKAHSLARITGDNTLFLLEIETHLTQGNDTYAYDLLIVKYDKSKIIMVLQHFPGEKLKEISSASFTSGAREYVPRVSLALERCYLYETTWIWNHGKFIKSNVKVWLMLPM